MGRGHLVLGLTSVACCQCGASASARLCSIPARSQAPEAKPAVPQQQALPASGSANTHWQREEAPGGTLPGVGGRVSMGMDRETALCWEPEGPQTGPSAMGSATMPKASEAVPGHMSLYRLHGRAQQSCCQGQPVQVVQTGLCTRPPCMQRHLAQPAGTPWAHLSEPGTGHWSCAHILQEQESGSCSTWKACRGPFSALVPRTLAAHMVPVRDGQVPQTAAHQTARALASSQGGVCTGHRC